MTQEQAEAKVVGIIREATEFSILVMQLMTVCKAGAPETDVIVSVLVKPFAKSHGLTEEDVWTVLHGVTGHLREEPFAYFVLAPGRHKSDSDIGRYLQVLPASNRELELALERGLELHSFDAKAEVPQ